MLGSRRRRFRLPITLSVLLFSTNVVLMVCWIVLLAWSGSWGMLTVGTILFVLVLIGLAVYLYVTIKEIQLNQRQANFVDSVTHELKTPIASVRLALDTLRLRPMPADKQEGFHRRMAEDLDRLERLIDQLLEVGRLDAIAGSDATHETDLLPVLRYCAETACRRHRRPDDAIRLAGPAAWVKGGQLPLEMIFGNLFENALKYGGDPPLVEVQIRFEAPNLVQVAVGDNGAGVPPDLRQRIFKLFVRGGDELRREVHGTGVGLHIVQTLVRRLKGRIAVRGRDRGTGAVFEVVLPARPAAPEQAATPAATSSPA